MVGLRLEGSLLVIFVCCSNIMFAMLSSVRPSVRLSVTFVQAIEIFGNVSKPFGTLAISDLSVEILRRSSQGNPSDWGLNARGEAKYNDFGRFEGYISVQDARYD